MSLTDTFNNFLIYTTCNLTSKYTCIREKLVNFIRFLNQEKHPESEKKFIGFIDHLVDRLDLDQFLNLFGYIAKLIVDYFDDDSFKFALKNATLFMPYKMGFNNSKSNEIRIANFLNRDNVYKYLVSLKNNLDSEKKL